MKSIKPGKQRKEFYNAPLHKKRKWLASHLEENLLLKYDKRAVSVVKGDTVKVMRGSFKGHENKVAGVNVKKNYIEIEGIFLTKADGKKTGKPIHPSNVLITKLNLTDKLRRSKLERGLSEETREEIEKEAEEQIREAEEERKRLEAEQKAKEAELEEAEEEISEEEKKEDKPAKSKAEKPVKEEVKLKTEDKKTKTATKSKQPVKKQETTKKTTTTKKETKPKTGKTQTKKPKKTEGGKK